MQILYQGLLQSAASWARVGRGLLSGLLELGVQPQVISARGFRFDSQFELPEGVQAISPRAAHQSEEPDVGLGFLHPPHLDRLLGKKRLNLFSWEADRVPRAWLEPLSTKTNLVIVPSEFTRHALIESGLDESHIAVLPHGFDPNLIQTRTPHDHQTMRYLVVAAPHWRKGVREICQAFRQVFTCQDNVLLHIKTNYDPGKARKRFDFEIPSWQELFETCGLNDRSAPAVHLDVATLGDREQMGLYATADLLVATSWGEAFGLAILESLAHGVPVLTTAWSGHMDFMPDSDDAVPFDLRPAGTALYEPVPDARVAVPQVPALAARMRWHYEHRAESAEIGQQGQSTVTHLTWRNAAQQLLTLV